LEEKVDNLSAQFTENHINRMKEETFDPRCSVIFTDMVIDLERSADHAHAIASNMLSAGKQKENKNIIA